MSAWWEGIEGIEEVWAWGDREVERDHYTQPSAPEAVRTEWERYGWMPANFTSGLLSADVPGPQYIVRGPLTHPALLAPAPSVLAAVTTDCRTDAIPVVGFTDLIAVLPELTPMQRVRAESYLLDAYGPSWTVLVDGNAERRERLYGELYDDELLSYREHVADLPPGAVARMGELLELPPAT